MVKEHLEAYIEASGDTSPYNYELFEKERKAAWEAASEAILSPYEDEETSTSKEGYILTDIPTLLIQGK